LAQKIDKRLIKKLREKTGLGPAAVYNRIEKRTREHSLPRHLAAISVAMDSGVNISRFATTADLAEIRGARSSAAPSRSGGDAVPVSSPAARGNGRGGASPSRGKRLKRAKKRGNSVFVVHGRNERLRKAMFQFLRATGVQPIEWSKAISMTGKPSPYIGEILETAFSKAQAVVVLFTPDDEAQLRKEFLRPSDPSYERKLTGQARPNVLFEAGLAFGTHPNQTVLVEVGKIRPFSDTAGRHVVHLNNSTDKRKEIMIKLRNAGCDVDFASSDWETEGDFGI
jgi:predicted nucleotide-binding protein